MKFPFDLLYSHLNNGSNVKIEKVQNYFRRPKKFVPFLDYFSIVVDNNKNIIIILFASRVR